MYGKYCQCYRCDLSNGKQSFCISVLSINSFYSVHIPNFNKSSKHWSKRFKTVHIFLFYYFSINASINSIFKCLSLVFVNKSSLKNIQIWNSLLFKIDDLIVFLQAWIILAGKLLNVGSLHVHNITYLETFYCNFIVPCRFPLKVQAPSEVGS